MITKEYARIKIQEWLDALEKPNGGWIIIDSMTIERPYGWMFFRATRAYLETKNHFAMPPGNSAILCLKDSGKLFFVGTAAPSAEYLEEFEKAPEEFQRRYRVVGVVE